VTTPKRKDDDMTKLDDFMADLPVSNAENAENLQKMNRALDALAGISDEELEEWMSNPEVGNFCELVLLSRRIF
jgi:hypothetical protein